MIRGIIIALIFLHHMAQAKQVSLSQARTVAKNFFESQGAVTIKMTDKAIVHYDEDTGQPLIYVFIGRAGKGFIIVSADDLCIPVLGYSTENAFASKPDSPEAGPWIKAYGKQVKAAMAREKKASAKTRELWGKYSSAGNTRVPRPKKV